MPNLISYGNEIRSIFQLLGTKENDITLSISWALANCPIFAQMIINQIFNEVKSAGDYVVLNQNYDRNTGVTDIEITDHNNYHIIFEAKRGWWLLSSEQLTKYSIRNDFANSPVKNKAIVSMSECNQDYANNYLPFKSVNNIPIFHLSWREIDTIALNANTNSNHAQKHLLTELREYLKGIITMQNIDSNWVYVVSLSNGLVEQSDNLHWNEIVEKYNRYTCPQGNHWPNEAPNYIAFRYNGKLQSIHHIENYTVVKNIHTVFSEYPDKEEKVPCFVFDLGSPIKPAKEVKTGKIYPSGRVWAMLDLLLTCDTISEARDKSQERKR